MAAAGAKSAARHDPSETYLVAATTTINTPSNTSARSGFIASRTPTAVATPLPPLNLNCTGHMWPMNARSPHAYANSGTTNPATRT